MPLIPLLIHMISVLFVPNLAPLSLLAGTIVPKIKHSRRSKWPINILLQFSLILNFYAFVRIFIVYTTLLLRRNNELKERLTLFGLDFLPT